MNKEQDNKTRNKCEALLTAMLGREDLATLWWSSPNKFFKYETPEKIYSESPDRVLQYLYSRAEGEW